MSKPSWNGQTRFAAPQDLPFLWEMLYEAAYWRTGMERPPFDTGMMRPDLMKILDGWGRLGDVAIIAQQPGGIRCGAVWMRYWTPENHSYGYIEAQTPELGIAVHPSYRQCGIGKSLMCAVLQYATEAGIGRLSLSVEPQNHARILYEQFGFRRVATNGGAWTMVVGLPHEGVV